MEGLKKSVKSLTQGKWTLGQDSNPRLGRGKQESRNTNRSKYDIV